MLDLHTYGNSKAAEHLVHRLNELNDPYINRHVSGFLSRRNRMVNALVDMHDRAARITFAILLKDDINKTDITGAPEMITTLARNVALSALKARVLCAPEYDPDDSNVRATTDEFDFDFGDVG